MAESAHTGWTGIRQGPVACSSTEGRYGEATDLLYQAFGSGFADKGLLVRQARLAGQLAGPIPLAIQGKLPAVFPATCTWRLNQVCGGTSMDMIDRQQRWCGVAGPLEACAAL